MIAPEDEETSKAERNALALVGRLDGLHNGARCAGGVAALVGGGVVLGGGTIVVGVGVGAWETFQEIAAAMKARKTPGRFNTP